VHTADGSYAPVYSFGHRHPSRRAEFLQIHTTADNNTSNNNTEPLEITAEHLLYIHAVGLRPARDVKPGDYLVTTQQTAPVQVTFIRKIQRQGVYAPFTATGNLVVNGIAASNYVALPAPLQSPQSISFEQQHWLQHAAYAPYRFLCRTTAAFNTNYCQRETYDEETGYSRAVTLWLPLLHWLEHQHPMVRSGLLHLVLHLAQLWTAVVGGIVYYKYYRYSRKTATSSQPETIRANLPTKRQ